jgi:hypothetical protein
MASWRFSKVKLPLALAAVCLFGLVAAGCDDHVQVTRDPDIRIHKGAGGGS